jgi:hypothetical protein
MINTTKNNKLLAEFMGCYQNNEGFWGFENTPNHKTWNNDRFLDCTKYDTDWNWLMEVVEKIESLGYDVFINTCVCRITDVGQNMFEDIECFVNNNKRQATYNACVEFVEWYNNQK